MTELSPAAQAVIDAFRAELEAQIEQATCGESRLVAAIRAAAEQMPSELPEVIHSVPEDARRWYRLGFQAAGHIDRSWLSAIAAELEAGG